jgi:hypothetical protein
MAQRPSRTYLGKATVKMPDKITFYAIVDDGTTVEKPQGLLRRLEFDGGGFTDEGLRRDFSWDFTPLIVEWEHGDFGDELVEVSHTQADKIVKYLRERWGPFGQSSSE